MKLWIRIVIFEISGFTIREMAAGEKYDDLEENNEKVGRKKEENYCIKTEL